MAFTFTLPLLFNLFFALPLAFTDSFSLHWSARSCWPFTLRLSELELAGTGHLDRELRRPLVLVELRLAKADLVRGAGRPEGVDRQRRGVRRCR